MSAIDFEEQNPFMIGVNDAADGASRDAAPDSNVLNEKWLKHGSGIDGWASVTGKSDFSSR